MRGFWKTLCAETSPTPNALMPKKRAIRGTLKEGFGRARAPFMAIVVASDLLGAATPANGRADAAAGLPLRKHDLKPSPKPRRDVDIEVKDIATEMVGKHARPKLRTPPTVLAYPTTNDATCLDPSLETSSCTDHAWERRLDT